MVLASVRRVAKLSDSYTRESHGPSVSGGAGSVDIDIVAKVLNDDLSSRIFACECKFTNKPVGFGEYNTLRSRMDAINGLDDVLMVFFSGSGFEDRFREFAEAGGIMLVGLEQLLGRVPPGPIPVPEQF